jgi:DNA-binding CsgD family transcriptional regulator
MKIAEIKALRKNREKRVHELISMGYKRKVISERLGLSANYISSLLKVKK